MLIDTKHSLAELINVLSKKHIDCDKLNHLILSLEMILNQMTTEALLESQKEELMLILGKCNALLFALLTEEEFRLVEQLQQTMEAEQPANVSSLPRMTLKNTPGGSRGRGEESR